jgi:uncharacterized protein (DUF2384 family)
MDQPVSLALAVTQLALNMADCSLREAEVTAILGSDVKPAERCPQRHLVSSYTEDRLRRLNALIEYAALIFGSREAAGTWLRQPNRALVGNRAPIDMLIANSMALHQLCTLLEEECASSYLLPSIRGSQLWM